MLTPKHNPQPKPEIDAFQTEKKFEGLSLTKYLKNIYTCLFPPTCGIFDTPSNDFARITPGALSLRVLLNDNTSLSHVDPVPKQKLAK